MLTLASDFDIIDEALQFFKANVFFRNYEIKVLCWMLMWWFSQYEVSEAVYNETLNML